MSLIRRHGRGQHGVLALSESACCSARVAGGRRRAPHDRLSAPRDQAQGDTTRRFQTSSRRDHRRRAPVGGQGRGEAALVFTSPPQRPGGMAGVHGDQAQSGSFVDRRELLQSVSCRMFAMRSRTCV